ncbi:MAG: lipid-A-disaccharide synthase [Nitrospirae bacterium]|nr:lipid-A-disaccharide synthase [Nitrospirota bacterium]
MKRVLMIAGETSGDIYGAELARHLYKLTPLSLTGIGGKRMREAGVDILYDSSEISVVGLSEILPRLRAIIRAYRIVTGLIKSRSTDFVILIDYPGFNIRVAGVAKRCGIPVVYYISPQIWAWKKGRLRLLAQRVKKMIVILPFEEAIYKEAGVDCSFIGHPLVDEVLNTRPLGETIHKYGIDKDQPVIGLFPGSRIGEVNALLPDILEAARILKDDNPQIRFVMAVADSLDFQQIHEAISRSSLDVKMDIKIIKGEANDVLNICDIIIAASGTITLQAALLEKPMVILYKLSPITHAIARLLVQINHIGLVNILAGRRIVPELLQREVTPDRIAAEVKKMLYDKDYYARIKKDLYDVKITLGPPGASERVARVIAGML